MVQCTLNAPGTMDANPSRDDNDFRIATLGGRGILGSGIRTCVCPLGSSLQAFAIVERPCFAKSGISTGKRCHCGVCCGCRCKTRMASRTWLSRMTRKKNADRLLLGAVQRKLSISRWARQISRGAPTKLLILPLQSHGIAHGHLDLGDR